MASIDDPVGASKDNEIQALYKTLHGKGQSYKMWDSLSVYANNNIREFIAEACSEYQNNPIPRDTAQQVGKRLIELRKIKFKGGKQPMMLTTETFVNMNVRGKSREEILDFIRKEQEIVNRLKEIIALPWFSPTLSPSEEMLIEHAEEYIKLAQAELEKLGRQ